MKLINISIDSMTMLVPLHCFDKMPLGIYDEVIEVNSETSEILDTYTKKIQHDFFGIKLRANLFQVVAKHYVAITVNSKMLRFSYLDGISMMNFAVIESYIQSNLKCILSYGWVNETLVFDCDFKADFYMNPTDYSSMLLAWRSCKGAKIYYSKKLNYLSEKQVTGLQFVNRKDASIRSPFVKIYDKHDEMLNRSIDFYDKFFPTNEDKIPFNDLKRLEVTVRNKDHFTSLGVENTTLYNILTLTPDTIKGIIKSLLFRHLDNNIPLAVSEVHDEKPKKLCMPKDYLVVKMIMILMKENNFTLAQCLQLLDDYPSLNDNTKSNIKRTLREAFKKVTHFHDVLNVRVSLKDAFLD